MTSFTFSKLINVDRLSLEISQSSITIALDFISVLGTEFTVYFKADLSDAEVITLNAIVAAHVNEHLPEQSDVSLDTEKAQIVRLKYAAAGWTYLERCIDFKTSSLYLSNFDESLNPLTDVKVYLYDSSNTLLNKYNQDGTPIIDDPSYALTVKTVVDYEPLYDYEIVGGYMIQEETPTDDLFANLIAVPDVPYSSGGSKVMIQNNNLMFYPALQKINLDGRTSKKLTYNSTYHTNKLRLILYHVAGYVCEYMIGLEHFKQ